jgi:hypothetical protein
MHLQGAGNCSLALQFQANDWIIQFDRFTGYIDVAQAQRALQGDHECLYSGKSARSKVMYTFYLAGTLVEELDYAF